FRMQDHGERAGAGRRRAEQNDTELLWGLRDQMPGAIGDGEGRPADRGRAEDRPIAPDRQRSPTGLGPHLRILTHTQLSSCTARLATAIGVGDERKVREAPKGGDPCCIDKATLVSGRVTRLTDLTVWYSPEPYPAASTRGLDEESSMRRAIVAAKGVTPAMIS